MKSVGNIQKITKAMKMVAASKMRSAQANTEKSRGIASPFLKLLGDLPAAEGKKNVYIPITTDRGLCGGINTTMAKYTRASMKAIGDEGGRPGTLPLLDIPPTTRRSIWHITISHPPTALLCLVAEGVQNEIIIVGEKGRSQLVRDQKDKIVGTVADTAKVRITFPQACAIADDVLKTEYDTVRIIFNRFASAIAYKPTIATVLSPDVSGRMNKCMAGLSPAQSLTRGAFSNAYFRQPNHQPPPLTAIQALEREAEAGGAMDQYEIEGPDRPELLQDLAEFQLATVRGLAGLFLCAVVVEQGLCRILAT
jgi:F0F1-type ATP synthase gamma subunit